MVIIPYGRNSTEICEDGYDLFLHGFHLAIILKLSDLADNQNSLILQQFSLKVQTQMVLIPYGRNSTEICEDDRLCRISTAVVRPYFTWYDLFLHGFHLAIILKLSDLADN